MIFKQGYPQSLRRPKYDNPMVKITPLLEYCLV